MSSGTKASSVKSRFVSPSQMICPEMMVSERISPIRQPRRGFTGRKAERRRKRKKPLASPRRNQGKFTRLSVTYSASRSRKFSTLSTA